MLDYYIGVVSMVRSLASYMVLLLEFILFFKDNIFNWFGYGYEVLGVLFINMLVFIFLVFLMMVFCRGVGESLMLNLLMMVMKVIFDFMFFMVW